MTYCRLKQYSAWDILKSFVDHVTNYHALLRESKVRSNDMPWITVDLRDQMYKRDHLRRVAVCSKSPSDYQNYRVQRNKNLLKSEYYDTVIKESADKPKSLWANLKQVLPKSTSTATIRVTVGDAEVPIPNESNHWELLVHLTPSSQWSAVTWLNSLLTRQTLPLSRPQASSF